ncbi:MAG: MFS transporter, partial [Pseudomonadota bacterium]
MGAIRAMAFSIMVFASAAGPFLVGWLIDIGVSLDIQIMGMGLYCLAFVAILSLTARAYRARQDGAA